MARTALILVDVINHMDFPGGDRLAEHAMRACPSLLRLRAAAYLAGAPVVYANDNYGDWSASLKDLVKSCSAPSRNGSAFTRRMRPTARDLFVLKARNSAFFCTALEPLLESFNVKTLVLAGLSAENCVLFTAHDAYLRGFKVVVPSDAVASESEQCTRRALDQMADALKARVLPGERVRFI